MSTSTRTRLWDADVNRDYWRGKKSAEAQADAERKGEPIAEKIDDVLAGMLADERDFLEFLVLSKIRKLVSPYEVDVLKRLVSKEILRLRPGVGTRLMQDYQTSFEIPDAIWDALDDRRETVFDLGGRSPEDRLRDLEKKLGQSIAEIVPLKPKNSGP